MSHGSDTPIPNPANQASDRFLQSLGIADGMRVLDVGCGFGDLSRALALLAGPRGEITGIDRSEEALSLARAVAPTPHAAPIRYHAADLAGDLPDFGRFDAIVGRRVLMYLPDAAATLSRLAALAVTGAILGFQEHGRAGLPAGAAPLPLHAQFYDLMWRTITAEGGDVALALRLAGMMRAAGLTGVTARSEAVLLDPAAPSFLPTLARAMLPRMVECGIADAATIGIDTLVERLADEHRRVGGLIVWDLAVFVSARAA